MLLMFTCRMPVPVLNPRETTISKQQSSYHPFFSFSSPSILLIIKNDMNKYLQR